MISVFQNSENSGYEYQVAPDMAMTVRMIMILLYGAGGVPGRGEIPMDSVSSRAPDDFLLCLGCRGQITHTNIAVWKQTAINKERRKPHGKL